MTRDRKHDKECFSTGSIVFGQLLHHAQTFIRTSCAGQQRIQSSYRLAVGELSIPHVGDYQGMPAAGAKPVARRLIMPLLAALELEQRQVVTRASPTPSCDTASQLPASQLQLQLPD